MRSLLKEDGSVTIDQGEISERQVEFYRKLYKSGDTDFKAQNTLIDMISKTLSIDHREACDADMNIGELYTALSAMKNNKSPGLDGLTTEFFRVFWDDLGAIILKLACEVSNTEQLPQSMRTGLITLIPKKGDLRKLTNWRPISLLNIDYKIITKTLASRVSKVINTLISEDQSCCIPGRNIADNVILMDNIIQYLGKNNESGYILKVDQYKAFDRVEHSYLLNVLTKMGFGDNFLRWVKLLYNNIGACIKHNGFVSDIFSIERGVRQGCPLSAILYVLSAEPFHEVILNCNNILGVNLFDKQAKIFQHADDTTFFVSDTRSIDYIFQSISIYERASGSTCNRHKTELYVIDHNPVVTNFNFPVRYDCIEILGVFLGKDRSIIENKNWVDRTDACVNILKRWKTRNLSFHGKALVINSLVISRLVYHASIIPVPQWVIDAIQKGINTFLWSDKKPAIAFEVLSLPKEKGGLNIYSLKCKRDSLRIRYVSRLLSNEINNKLRDIMLYNLSHYGDMMLALDTFRILPQFNFIRKLPSFYQELLYAWRKISIRFLLPPDSREEILRQPLFHNPFITDENGKVFYNSDFIKGGIIFCSDIMYEMIPSRLPTEAIHEVIVLSNPDTKSSLGDIGIYLDNLIRAMPSNWLDIIFSGDSIVSTIEECNMCLKLKYRDTWLDAGDLSTKLASLFLRNTGTVVPKGEIYWKKTYIDIHFEKRWNCVYGGIKENHDADLDFKILHNILFTNEKLYKFSMIDSPLCTFCNKEEESIKHLFIDCNTIKNFWRLLTQKLDDIVHLDSWEECTLLGTPLHKKNKQKILLDFLLNIYKKVIWSCRVRLLGEDTRMHGISVPVIFHNTARKKINILYHYFRKNRDLTTFWQIFDQADTPLVIEHDDDDECAYRYILDN